MFPAERCTWSEEHFRIFGFDPEKTEPSFQLFLETVHPEDRSFIERSLDEAITRKADSTWNFESRLRTDLLSMCREWADPSSRSLAKSIVISAPR